MPEHKYADEYIEFYAERYIELRLREQGITLLQYLATPLACEAVAERNAARGHSEPLILPQQITRMEAQLRRESEAEHWLSRFEAVTVQAEQPLAHLPRRDGYIVEKLCHHARPR